LVLSPHAIDTHPRRVFATLGITSRTRFARLLLNFAEAAGAGGVEEASV
jgi:DNA-binding CsgD family transcriptional regulator